MFGFPFDCLGDVLLRLAAGVVLCGPQENYLLPSVEGRGDSQKECTLLYFIKIHQMFLKFEIFEILNI